MRQRAFTCYLGGDAGGDGRAEALVRGSFEGEEVGGPRVETHEQVMGLIPQLEHPSPLGGQISAGVQRAQGLVGDLKTDGRQMILTHFSFNMIDLSYVAEVSLAKVSIATKMSMLENQTFS